MNTQNYLTVSDLAYENLREKQIIPAEDGVQYEVVKALHTKSGYDGYILYRKDTNELIVAHRGTWPEKGAWATDALTDLGMAVNQANSQYPDAKRLTEMAIELSRSEYKGAAIRQTGRSLGGTLAQLCAYNYGHQAETYNAYGAGHLKEKEPGRQSNAALITNHVRAADPVSAAGPHLGRVLVYAGDQDLTLLRAAGYNREKDHSPWLAAVGGAALGHGLNNFSRGGLSPQQLNTALEHKGMISAFRTEFEREARQAGSNVRFIQEQIDRAVKQGKSFLKLSDASDTTEKQFAQALEEAGSRLPPYVRGDASQLAAAAPAEPAAQKPQSKYDEVRAMLDGLLNDTDGSYARKVLAEHPEKAARFDEKVRQSIEQDRQREMAERESRTIQHEEQQRGFSRTFG